MSYLVSFISFNRYDIGSVQYCNNSHNGILYKWYWAPSQKVFLSLIFSYQFFIATSSKDFYFYLQENRSLEPGTGVRNPKYRWPRVGNKIFVPFLIDPRSRYASSQIDRIYTAMTHISERTCVNFKWRSDEDNFLFIHSGKWCNSYIGMMGGGQKLSLEKNSPCGNHLGTIIHELVHSLGFAHMQSHGLRDGYVKVINENIMRGAEYQFEKFYPWETTNFGTPYDYYSIMHYDSFAFSRNGKPTIIAKSEKFNRIIGRMERLSYGDVMRIRRMYNCECVENMKICWTWEILMHLSRWKRSKIFLLKFKFLLKIKIQTFPIELFSGQNFKILDGSC